MPDEPGSQPSRARQRDEGVGPPERLVNDARASLRATDVYARALTDRLELVHATDPCLLDGVPADVLLHLKAVSDAFQDAACHTLWFVEPELARSAQVVAGLARDREPR